MLWNKCLAHPVPCVTFPTQVIPTWELLVTSRLAGGKEVLFLPVLPLLHPPHPAPSPSCTLP